MKNLSGSSTQRACAGCSGRILPRSGAPSVLPPHGESRAREAFASAERWEDRARRDAQAARREAERLAAIPRLPRDDALREDERLQTKARRREDERAQLEQEISGLIRQVIQEASFVASTLTR